MIKFVVNGQQVDQADEWQNKPQTIGLIARRLAEMYGHPVRVLLSDGDAREQSLASETWEEWMDSL